MTSTGRLLAVLLVMSVAACAARPPAPETPTTTRNAFDGLIDDILARYRLPGLAVGVVVDGEITYVRTEGEVIAGSGQPITPDTLFKIASNSKAMTTGVIARLVEARKLRWDDPVVRHLPSFRMSDPWVTREMQVRDLLLHTSGLRRGSGDLMLWPEPNLFTRADIIAALAHFRPVYSFRSRYAYDNILYIVAGEVAAAAAGMSYEELIRRELFQPLGMTRCQVGEWRRDDVGNVAQPHMRQGDRHIAARLDEELIPFSTSAAAGGIRCSLSDMLKWVRMWLHPELEPVEGAPPWLSRAQRDVLWTAHVPLPLSRLQREWNNTHFNGYGYGWRVSDVDGVLSVAHTGTLFGMYSAVTLLPDKKAGFVILMSGDGSEARFVLNQLLIKHFTAPEATLSVAHYAEQLERLRAQVEPPDEREAPAATPRRPAVPAAMRQWLGLYRDAWFGEVSICEKDGRVRLRSAKSPRMAGDVMYSGGRLLVDWHDDSIDAEAWLSFAAADAVTPVTLSLIRIDPDSDTSYNYEDLLFRRVRDCQ